MFVRSLYQAHQKVSISMSGQEIALAPCHNCHGEVEFLMMNGTVRGVECPNCKTGLYLRTPKVSLGEKKRAIADAWKCWGRV